MPHFCLSWPILRPTSYSLVVYHQVAVILTFNSVIVNVVVLCYYWLTASFNFPGYTRCMPNLIVCA